MQEENSDTCISFISIQNENFFIDEELKKLKENTNVGALVSFVGLVRADGEATNRVSSITLEHYSGMCEKQIQGHINQAAKRWPLLAVNVVHRIGNLKVGEQIVLVAVSSQHRKAAFHAAEFIMDYLKNEAPFWKKQHSIDEDVWVEAKAQDKEALVTWHREF